MLRFAAKLCAQLWPLRGNSGGACIQVALPRHVTPQRNQNCSAESELVSPEQRSHHNVARRAQSAIGSQPHSSAQSIVDEHLLCLG
jgi:hypothetical protein